MSFLRTLTREFTRKLQRTAALARCRWFGVGNPEGVFDSQYYLSRYPDLRNSGMDPLFHYLWFGANEGRQPNPLFDGAWYLNEYPDVAASGANPLLHFLKTGGREGRPPHPLFDSAYYLSTYPDVRESGVNPLEHFLLHGCSEGRLPNDDFIPEEYLAANPDLAGAGIEPVEHFVKHGLLDNRPLRPVDAGFNETDLLPVGEPPPALTPPLTIDVIVPVYRGLAETRACLDSVRSARCAVPFRLIVINDASPEPELSAYLREAVRAGHIELLENEKNLGFVHTVNRGMSLSTNDVVLLNSDTMVFNGWLDRLARCAHSDSKIGTVTPFSNNATICSYPVIGEDNPVPPDLDLASLDRDFATVNAGRCVDIPTAIGFCMYIRRDCLTETGDFDADTFGAGYGEENDFSVRAAQRGWRNVLACDVFVYHAGGVSFGQASVRQENAMKALLRKHPRYLEAVRAHIHRDPAKPFRAAVAAYRFRNSGRKVFLSVSHALGGGVAQHVEELAEDTRHEVLWLHLAPAPSGFELKCTEPPWRFTIRFDALNGPRRLPALLRACGVERIHIHHTLGFPPGLENIVAAAGVPFDFTVHDYYAICSLVTLVDRNGDYCGEPGGRGCERCIESRTGTEGVTDLISWRYRHAWLFAADRVLAPSVDTANRIHRYHPGANVIAAAHRQDPTAAVTARTVEGARPLQVAVLGTMAPHKGFQTLQECAEIAASRNLPLAFTLIGKVEDAIRPQRLSFTETGAYKTEELPELLRKTSPDLVWFPTRSPETFSYTLSACLELGLPVAVPDLGALPERVGGRPWSWVKPYDFSACNWADFFVSIRAAHFATGIPPEPPPVRAQARKLPDWYRHTAVRRGTAHGRERLSIAATVASFEKTGQIQACGFVRVVCPLTHSLLSGTVQLQLVNPAFAHRMDAAAILVQRLAVAELEQAEQLVERRDREGLQLIYETDDDLISIDCDHVDYAAYAGRIGAARFLIAKADLVTAPTAELLRKLAQINPNTRLVPNYLDERVWLPSPAIPVEGDTIRLVFAGTMTHAHDLDFLGEAVRQWRRKWGSKVQLDVVGVSAGRFENWYNVINVPYHVASSYPRYARWFRQQAVRHRWQWGVAPLLDTPFNRCKSPIKVLEYGAAGLPSICSDVLPYSAFVTNGENGVLVPNDPDVWADALHRAVSDTSLRQRILTGATKLVSANTLAANATGLREFWSERASFCERAARLAF